MVINIYAKSYYDQFCIDKALGFLKSDLITARRRTRMSQRKTFLAIGDPLTGFQVPKTGIITRRKLTTEVRREMR